MRTLLIGGAVAALVVALSACGGSDSVDSELQRQVDLHAISQIEKDFHESMSKKDLDQMMRLWTENATMTGGAGITAAGKAEIRKFWAAAPPFQPENKWVSDHPAYKLRATVNGDRGTLFFECHFVDAPTGKVELVTAIDADVQRIDGRWLITSTVGSAATLAP